MQATVQIACNLPSVTVRQKASLLLDWDWCWCAEKQVTLDGRRNNGPMAASSGSTAELEKQLIAAAEAGDAETVSQVLMEVNALLSVAYSRFTNRTGLVLCCALLQLLDKGVDVAWQEPEEGCSALSGWQTQQKR